MSMTTNQVRAILEKFYKMPPPSGNDLPLPSFNTYKPTDEFIIEQEYHCFNDSPTALTSFHLKTTAGDYFAVAKSNGLWTCSFISNGLSMKEALALKHLTREDLAPTMF